MCSWKGMHDFIMFSDAQKSATVYESCSRALDAANRYTSRTNMNRRGTKSRRTRRLNMSVKSRETPTTNSNY